jgi:uncharacterized protein (TIGR02246 family)
MIGLKKVVSFFAGFLLLAGYAAAASAAQASTDEAAIHAITQARVKAYNAGDAKTVSGLYAEQAVLLPPGAPAAKGKAAIQSYFAKDTAESAKAGVTFSIDAGSAVGTSGDLAWESGTYAVKAKSGAKLASTLPPTRRAAGSGSLAPGRLAPADHLSSTCRG